MEPTPRGLLGKGQLASACRCDWAVPTGLPFLERSQVCSWPDRRLVSTKKKINFILKMQCQVNRWLCQVQSRQMLLPTLSPGVGTESRNPPTLTPSWSPKAPRGSWGDTGGCLLGTVARITALITMSSSLNQPFFLL